MNLQSILRETELAHCVKEIFILESKEELKRTVMPFYADGFPGIMFRQSLNEAVLLPAGKRLSDFFLYGQTITPIQIAIEGSYKFIVFQLYPFSGKALFNVDTKRLVDECYDLHLVDIDRTARTLALLNSVTDTELQIRLIADYIKGLEDMLHCTAEVRIQMALHLILKNKGNISIKKITEHLHITERTLQRLFIEYVGISPKQFTKIIQFQSSVSLISDDSYQKLTDVVYETGYADQSHFIRYFKKFTGKKPSEYKTLK